MRSRVVSIRRAVVADSYGASLSLKVEQLLTSPPSGPRLNHSERGGYVVFVDDGALFRRVSPDAGEAVELQFEIDGEVILLAFVLLGQRAQGMPLRSVRTVM